ncbi:TMV resistance protein N [Morella rubra]|uniref:TMV resistance protein N n=1 Tax=Morella rubra TaxID=262757 RepID=A0A6A1UKD1_9ROSI|nr:TMV resistance protein N [Morella rubra]
MFGRGSRIIITSRDGHLLEKFVNFIYPVNQLNNDEALQLFSLSAFKELHPENSYMDLSKSFVQYAQGLPLALKVLGSFLFRRTTVAWDAAWKELQENPKKKILDVLQIGFDALEDLQKKLFLDIACFFKGKKIDDILDVIESFGFYPLINIEVLVERSLITISRERLINMHDLLQKMGHEIVRRESPDEPGQRSRLWHYKDVLRVLKDNSGTDVVEGIVLNLPIHIEEQLSVRAFSQMKKLRILKIGSKNIIENFSEQLSTIEWDGDALNSMPTIELRLMKWFGFPFLSLPRDFNADNLVELNMRGSSIKQLWKGNKSLGSLKRLVLSSSQSLMETPDFSKAQNLEMIDLEGCKILTTVHPSIGVLKRLKQLDLSFCENLRELPDKISLESLEDFILSGCSRLEKFPDIVGNMTSLGLLYLDGTGIREVPPSFRNLCGLTILSFRDCEKLLKLPINMCRLSSLRFLQLSGCRRLEKFPDLRSMECLEELYAVGTAITQLSPNPFPRSIKTLRLTGFASSFGGIPVHQKLSNYNPLARTFRKELRCFSKKGCELTLYSPNEYNVLHVEVRSESCEGTSTVGTKVMHGSLFTSHGMPDWFNNESGCVNSDIIKLPHLDNNRKWIGYAMFIEYDILFGHLPPGQYPYDKDYLRLVRSAYDWMNTGYNEDGSDLSDSNLVMFTWEFMNIRINVPPKRLHLFAPEQVWNTCPEYSNVFRPEYSTKRGIWTYIPAQWFLEQFMNLDPLSDDIRSSGPTWTTAYPDFRVVVMNKWGAREVYEDNASEFFSSIAPPNLKPEFYSCLSYYFGKGSLGAQPPPLIDLVEFRPGKKDVAEKGDFITLLKSEAIYNCIAALDIFGSSSSSSFR